MEEPNARECEEIGRDTSVYYHSAGLIFSSPSKAARFERVAHMFIELQSMTVAMRAAREKRKHLANVITSLILSAS